MRNLLQPSQIGLKDHVRILAIRVFLPLGARLDLDQPRCSDCMEVSYFHEGVSGGFVTCYSNIPKKHLFHHNIKNFTQMGHKQHPKMFCVIMNSSFHWYQSSVAQQEMIELRLIEVRQLKYKLKLGWVTVWLIVLLIQRLKLLNTIKCQNNLFLCVNFPMNQTMLMTFFDP